MISDISIARFTFMIGILCGMMIGTTVTLIVWVYA